MAYNAQDKKKIKALKDAGVELKGDETSEVLDTLMLKLEADSAAEEGENKGPEEIPGVPNALPIRTETIHILGKDITRGIFFVVPVQNGVVAYNDQGQRISPVVSDPAGKSVLVKQVARFNALHRQKRD